jgi:hypothetical protein
MKIEYKPEGSGSYTTLVDESAGGVIEDWNPTSSLGASQTENLAAMPNATQAQFRQSLGNQNDKVSMKINVVYADRSAALAASRTVRTALVGAKNTFKVSEPTGASPETQYYHNAIVKTIASNVQGANVTYVFAFDSDLVSTS